MLKKFFKRFWKDNGGTALVEGAVLTPVLIVLFLGVFEFSFYFYQQQLISTGVRDAARYLARSSDPSSSTNQTYAKNLATTGSISSGGTYRVKGWTASAITVTVSSVANTGTSTPCGSSACYSGFYDSSGNSIVKLVTVSTVFTDPSLGLFGVLGLSAPSISVSHTERVIGIG